MKEILSFLDQLLRNNDREWFLAHKSQYEDVQQRFNHFTEQLIVHLSHYDPTLSSLTVKDCTYRIYKDLRFSKDKLPYKTHMGAYLCPHGRKSGYSGYYFHLEPSESEYMGGSMLAVGLYNPDPELLKAVRERIAADGAEFEKRLLAAKPFLLDSASALKRVPKEFASDHLYAQYLKQKNYTLFMPMPSTIFQAEEPAQLAAELFKVAVPFNSYLNEIKEDLMWK